jgi:predicted component of type VI protein secretion system
MGLTLVVLTAGRWQGKPLSVIHFPFVVGRDPGCQLRPGSSKVSRRHCALLARDGRFFLHDFGSTNGTLLNDRALLGGTIELMDGDRVEVGPLTFAVLIAAGENTDGPVDPSAEPPPVPRHAAPPASADEEAASLELLLAGAEGDSPGHSPGGVEASEDTAVDPPGPDQPRAEPAEEEVRSRWRGPGGKPEPGGAGAVARELLKKYRRSMKEAE